MYDPISLLWSIAGSIIFLALGQLGLGWLLNSLGEDGTPMIQGGLLLLCILVVAAIIVGAMFLVAELRERKEIAAKDWASKQPENQWGHFVEVSPEGIVYDLRINRLGMRKIIKPTGASINDLNKTGYITYEYSGVHIPGYPDSGGTITFWTGDPGIADGDFVEPTRAFRSSFKVSISPVFYADTVGSDQFRKIIDERFARRKNFTWEQVDAFVKAKAEEKAYAELKMVK